MLNYVGALRSFRRQHRHLEGVYLIHDGDPSHTAANTQDYLAEFGRCWHPCRTPVNASWLNQVELLLDAFVLLYLQRGAWQNRADFPDPINVPCPQYPPRYDPAFGRTLRVR